jgi:hypothetical protein
MLSLSNAPLWFVVAMLVKIAAVFNNHADGRLCYLVGAQGYRSHADPPWPYGYRLARPAAADCRRSEALLQGGYHPVTGQQGWVYPGADDDSRSGTDHRRRRSLRTGSERSVDF